MKEDDFGKAGFFVDNYSKKDVLIFDVGNVLLEYRWHEMLMDYGLSDEDAKVAGDTLFENNLWGELDLGTQSKDEIIRQYQKAFPQYADLVYWFLTHGEYMHIKRPDVWKRVHALKQKGYRIYLLSNYSQELFETHTADADFMNDIDGKVVSYQIHKTKPDPAIYQYLLKKYNLSPDQCIFFDDRLENTKAAQDLGICSYTIDSKEYLLRLLDELLV